MQVQIESFSDYKTNEYGPSAKVKLSSGDTCYINEEPAPLVGKTVDIILTDKTSQKGKIYKIGKISKVYEQSTATAANTNGKITWDDYRELAKAAHELAKQLEPDAPEGGIDRSPARVGFVNNVMRAYAEGRFIVPKDDEDSEIPPF